MFLRSVFLFLLSVTLASSLLTYYRAREDADSAMENDEALDGDSTTSAFLRHRRGGRLCGTQLTKTIQKVCAGCIKANHNEQDAVKRSEFWSAPPKRQSLVKDCCQNKCTLDYLKQYCC